MKISEFQIWWDGLYHRHHIGKNRGFLLSRSLRKKWGNSWRLDRADFTAVLPRKMTWKLSQFLEHLTPDFASYVSGIEISTLPRGPASRAGSGDPHDISRTRILSKNACFCSQKLWTFLSWWKFPLIAVIAFAGVSDSDDSCEAPIICFGGGRTRLDPELSTSKDYEPIHGDFPGTFCNNQSID